ncbi:hypothetical protein KM176_24095 [Pseudooceanicola sp. CBS1P-1]|uniref:hypothetical protein n=1 Tax=Pseudooceanicola TaxID=1679449 RepID=UPI0019277D02|nr:MULTISPECIES: hypothetical protein [Pseudooceanicola]MBT9386945.1 hypothetical protein [Pseudooceanicola endophyticus]
MSLPGIAAGEMGDLVSPSFALFLAVPTGHLLDGVLNRGLALDKEIRTRRCCRTSSRDNAFLKVFNGRFGAEGLEPLAHES